jgi:hypothetical protein
MMQLIEIPSSGRSSSRTESSPLFAECRVTNDGTNEGNICPGQGLTIVEALVRSLGGTLDQYVGPQGATLVLIFPYRPLNETSCIDVE